MVAIVRLRATSIRRTVPPIASATHTDPAPTARPDGAGPNGIARPSRRFVAASIWTSVPRLKNGAAFATHKPCAFAVRAEGHLPVWTVATTRAVAGLTRRTIPFDSEGETWRTRAIQAASAVAARPRAVPAMAVRASLLPVRGSALMSAARAPSHGAAGLMGCSRPRIHTAPDAAAIALGPVIPASAVMKRRTMGGVRSADTGR